MGKPQCCKECGYLGIRNNETRELVEVDEAYREHGRNPRGGKLPQLYHGAPVCPVMAHDLSQETKHAEGRDVVEMLSKARDCGELGKSTTWQRGFTPKEHIQMNLLEQQEERHRTWEKEDREERQKQADRDHAWREKQAASDRRWRILELAVMVLIVTGVSVVAQITAAFIERGSLFPDNAPAPAGAVRTGETLPAGQESMSLPVINRVG